MNNTAQNGKGSKSRVTNPRKFRQGYDAINWGSKKTSIKEQYFKDCLKPNVIPQTSVIFE